MKVKAIIYDNEHNSILVDTSGDLAIFNFEINSMGLQHYTDINSYIKDTVEKGLYDTLLLKDISVDIDSPVVINNIDNYLVVVNGSTDSGNFYKHIESVVTNNGYAWRDLVDALNSRYSTVFDSNDVVIRLFKYKLRITGLESANRVAERIIMGLG